MAGRRPITKSPSLYNETWLDFRDDRTDHLLQHLQSDNRAFEKLRIALEEDFEEICRRERDPERVDALT